MDRGPSLTHKQGVLAAVGVCFVVVPKIELAV